MTTSPQSSCVILRSFPAVDMLALQCRRKAANLLEQQDGVVALRVRRSLVEPGPQPDTFGFRDRAFGELEHHRIAAIREIRGLYALPERHLALRADDTFLNGELERQANVHHGR